MIIAFTGKRPTGLYGYSNREKIYEWCTEEIAKALEPYIQPNIEIRTGGAQGADMLAFDAVRSLQAKGNQNIQNRLFVPFPEQADRWPDHGYFNRKVWAKHIKEADDVIYVYPDNSGNIVGKLMGRNNAMLKDADRLIAIVKQPDPIQEIKGGTGQSIRTALKQNIPITLIRFGGTEYNRSVCIEEY